MRPGAPAIHENLTTHFKLERFARGDDTGEQGNIASHIQHRLGDVEKGFREADVVLEREYHTGTVHQGYIEPHASTATWTGDGRLTVWTCTQGSFAIRSSTAAILRRAGGHGAGDPHGDRRRVRRQDHHLLGARLAAILSKKTGRPVKMVMSRKDVFEGTGPTSACTLRTKIGAKKDGTITAAHVWMAFEAGAFPGSPVGWRHPLRHRPLQHREPAGRRLRRGGQQAEGAGLPRPRPAPGRLRRRADPRRAGRRAGHGPHGPAPEKRGQRGATGCPTVSPTPVSASAKWKRQ